MRLVHGVSAPSTKYQSGSWDARLNPPRRPPRPLSDSCQSVVPRFNIDFRIVLPFVPDRFRSTSVVDSSAEWGGTFDLVLRKAESAGNLMILDEVLSDEEAYKYATRMILAEANAAAAPDKALAIIVWEGKPRGPDDFTLQFRNLAIEAGMRERVVLTRSET